ncbi:endonuclease/exonuclease/phosphatase family protein [Nonomuraea bangladeshensis]|uniref:endonuclease/exonuclease/phosphatase family protein n=1 Tax=Nonomuraea bangladeshensis TaxID=404385 RepID=UPI0031E3BFBB
MRIPRSARRLTAAVAAVCGLVLALAPPAAAAPAPVTVRPLPVSAVAPMGAEAAAQTARARAGRARAVAPAGAAREGRAGTLAARRFHELQLNLCNSGHAGCYAGGQAVYEGGDLIYYLAPDLVTLNEICAGDLPAYLQPSLAEAWPDDWTYSLFYPALNKQTGAPITCTNGDSFGNAVLGRVPAALWQGVNGWAGEYTTQDGGTEKRTFACAYAIGDHLACATHLSSSSEPIALAQCRALMFSAVPAIRSAEGISGRTVVGGDFNLEYDTSDPENAQNCVPAGHIRKGDGDVQHVIFSNDLTFGSTGKYGLSHTDHDGFLVRLTKP